MTGVVPNCNWREEFAALPEHAQETVRATARAFCVPLMNAYFRAKSLGLLPDQTVPQLGGSREDLRNVLCGVIEIFGLEGAEKITTYALKHRGINAFDGRKIAEALPPMPETVDRRPFDDDEPDGYLESDTDWAQNNWEAVRWFADNHAAIRAAISR
jgi:hypothetical protein